MTQSWLLGKNKLAAAEQIPVISAIKLKGK
jgi:hypothetical protein